MEAWKPVIGKTYYGVFTGFVIEGDEKVGYLAFDDNEPVPVRFPSLLSKFQRAIDMARTPPFEVKIIYEKDVNNEKIFKVFIQ